jgi:mycothiol synthase
VHPSEVGSDLEDQVVLWAEERVRAASRERGVPMKLRSSALRGQADRRTVLERHGMEPVRYFFRMARALNEPIAQPRLPDGFSLQHTRGIPDAAAWVDVFNQSFIDHWNYHPATVAEHTHWLQHPSYRVEHDLVAVAPNGTFAAFCFCGIDPDENAANGRNEGWIKALGTRRGYRKMGLGRAMLLHGMQRLKADGAEWAVLGVDAENPSGALRLYEGVGFHTIREFILYSKDV